MCGYKEVHFSYVFLLAGGEISWRSGKQLIVLVSTIEV